MGLGFIAKILSFTRVDKDDIKLSDVKINPDGGSNITAQHFSAPGDDSYPLETDYVAVIGVRRNGGVVVIGYADPLSTPKATKGEKRSYARDPDSGEEVCQVWLKSTGEIVSSNGECSITQKPDGTIELLNDKGSVALKPDGEIASVNDNGSIELKPDGEVVASNGGGDIALKPAGALEATVTTSATVTAPAINLTGNVIISGSLSVGGVMSAVSGALTASGGMVMTSGDLIADGKSLKTHVHPQGNDSNGDSQVNTGAAI